MNKALRDSHRETQALFRYAQQLRLDVKHPKPKPAEPSERPKAKAAARRS